MSGAARTGVLVATAAALVVAFIVLSPGDDEPATTTGAPTATAAAPPGAETATIAPEPKKSPGPKYTPVVVRDGRPVGGVQKIEVRNGDRVRLRISSPDTSDEVHVHGYDLMRELAPGSDVRLVFTADADGIFEVELENAGVDIARIVVAPS